MTSAWSIFENAFLLTIWPINIRFPPRPRYTPGWGESGCLGAVKPLLHWTLAKAARSELRFVDQEFVDQEFARQPTVAY